MADEAPATPPIAISTEVTVPLERITNSLIGALEGGSTYWLREIGYVEGSATGKDYERRVLPVSMDLYDEFRRRA